jgi:phenylalanyl-tRNA synthetase beta chain
MNISYRWLRELAPGITDDPQRIAERLGMLGAPVDELLELAAEIGDVVIGRVESVRPHPDADRLRICSVSTGAGESLQVVCGAPNVEEGGYYPFAPVGASLPGGMVIRKAKLRGEISEGMLCSARELGLGREHTGLMALSGEWQPGGSFVEQLDLEDSRLVVDITPNRADLLSHVGVARELSPEGVRGVQLRPFGGADETSVDFAESRHEGTVGEVRVRIEDAEGCRRYMAAIVRGVQIGPSPEWLATRLRAIGVRPINNVVDATNYVLHELGQPLHAFDLARIGGNEIRIRRAANGEVIRTLDGVDRELGEGMLVIADVERPVALAGVMGGEDSEVAMETTDILLECALFDELLVRRTARGFALSSDSSYRFERGVDPELQPVAARRALDLIVAVAGGTVEPGGLDLRPAPHVRPVITLRPQRVSRLLGLSLSPEEIASLLTPIGFEVQPLDDGRSGLRISVPGFRPDVTREIDLVEEIARRRGYDSFSETLPAFRPGVVPEDPLVGTIKRTHALLAGWGLLEARTVAFAPAAVNRVALLNPLSAEESHLRDAMGPGLLRRLEHNWAHGVRDVRLYEIGSVFFPDGDARPREEVRLAVVLTGARRPPHWSEERTIWDLWDTRGLLEEIARELGFAQVMPATSDCPGLVNEESFVMVAGEGEIVGWGGRVDRGQLDPPAWAEPVWLLELKLPVEADRSPGRTYEPLPEYPGSERDLALLLPGGVSAASVEQVIRSSAGELLKSLLPFDLYAGEGIPEGTTSVAWRLRFQRADRTLTDKEVDAAVVSVLKALEKDLDVRRR